VSIYLYKYALNYPHNPFFFLPYFIQNVIAPLTLTIFEFSLFKFSFYSSAFTVLLLLFFFSQEKKNPRSRFLWPLIFIPAFGVLYHQWDERYNFWRDLIFSPSSFLCITFAITSMIAFHFPRKFFYLYAAVIISISYMWSYQWKSVSDLIQVSILSLPQEFEYKVEAKRLLVWELFYEKQNKRAENILNALIEENPQNKVLQDDLKHYRAQEEQASKIDNSLQSSR
jgi:hypothetical protein